MRKRLRPGLFSSHRQPIAALINDLLDVSRLNVGKFALELADLDLAAVVRQTIEEYPTDEDHPIRVISSGGSIRVSLQRVPATSAK